MNIFIAVIITVFVLVSGNAYAKSENSGSGNSGSASVGGNSNSESHGKASVGDVKEVNPNKITIEEKKTNKKVEADVDSSTEIIHQGNKGPSLNKGKGSINSIKKDDRIAIVGTESATEHKGKIGKALKIFIKEATTSGQSKRRAIQGVVLSIDGTTINIAHQIHRDRTNSVFTDSATIFKIKGIENGSIADVKAGNRIVAMGEATNSGILARRVHVIPGKATGIFRRLPVSTSSGTPSASPSATPSATPEATISGVEGVSTDPISDIFSSLLKLFSKFR